MAEAATSTFGQHVNIEPGLQVSLNIDGHDGKVKSQVVGLIPGEFLVLTAPIGVSGIREQLGEGNKVTVRYVYNGFVYGFETQIMTLITRPRTMMIIYYPQKSASVTLRKSERVNCFINCTLTIENEEYCGTIMDISQCGCRCLIPLLPEKTYRQVEKDSIEAKLSFTAPNDKNELELNVRIVNHTIDGAASKLGVGYNEPDEVTATRIRKLCEFLDR